MTERGGVVGRGCSGWGARERVGGVGLGGRGRGRVGHGSGGAGSEWRKQST